jgi:hypothetical protein
MRRGNHLDQYILAFAVEFGREQADAGGVAAGMRERFDQSRRHHVLGHSDKRYRVRERLQRLQRKLGTGNDRIGGGVDQRCGLLGEMLIGRLKTTRDNYEIGARSIRSQTVGRLGIGGCTKCMGHRMNLLPHFVRSPKMDWALLILGGAFGIAAVAIVLWGRSRK